MQNLSGCDFFLIKNVMVRSVSGPNLAFLSEKNYILLRLLSEILLQMRFERVKCVSPWMIQIQLNLQLTIQRGSYQTLVLPKLLYVIITDLYTDFESLNLRFFLIYFGSIQSYSLNANDDLTFKYYNLYSVSDRIYSRTANVRAER